MTNNNPFSADAYLIALFVSGLLGAAGVTISTQTLATAILAVYSGLAIIVPAIIAGIREMRHHQLNHQLALATLRQTAAAASATLLPPVDPSFYNRTSAAPVTVTPPPATMSTNSVVPPSSTTTGTPSTS